MIDKIKEEARKTLISHGNKVWYHGALGKPEYSKYIKDAKRLSYLFGVLNNIYYDEGYFLGDTEVLITDVLRAIENIRHYQGLTYDLSSIGSSSTPTPPSDTLLSGLIRTGHKTVTIGATSVTFSSPLPSANYTVRAWVIGAGESQYDLGTLTLSANGFTASDISINGTLYYQAIINI